MKLRIRGNSLRLRLSQSEVKRLQGGEVVMETVQFHADSQFVYGLKTQNQISAITAHFEGQQIWITVPEKQAIAWATTEKVEMLADQENGSEQKLKILIEKDFTCLKTRMNENEDEADLFANPNEAHGSCG